MIVTIQLRRGVDVIGAVAFDVQDEVEAYGRVASVTVPGDRALERRIKYLLNGNPESVSIAGGQSTADVGNYAEGVLNVLHRAMDDHDFEFDTSDLPRLVIPPDVVM